MPITVVVGGQFGSEGKGKVAHFLATTEDIRHAVRVGGPNSGHTAYDDLGRRHILRQIPTPAISSRVCSYIAAGSYISLQVLEREIGLLKLSPKTLKIHPNAVIITQAHIDKERAAELNERLGSTETGMGSAVWARLERRANLLTAKDCPQLSHFVSDVDGALRAALDNGERAIIEGTQGFGLSLMHSPHYPFVTSRDTSAAAFVSEAGLSPLDVDDIVLVLRSFPIRVPGNSGPLPNPTSWDEIARNAGTDNDLTEFTSVTNHTRRIARFDPEIVKLAMRSNQPTRIVLNHLDYVDWECRNQQTLSLVASRFLTRVQHEIGQEIRLCGTSETILTTPNIRYVVRRSA